MLAFGISPGPGLWSESRKETPRSRSVYAGRDVGSLCGGACSVRLFLDPWSRVPRPKPHDLLRASTPLFNLTIREETPTLPLLVVANSIFARLCHPTSQRNLERSIYAQTGQIIPSLCTHGGVSMAGYPWRGISGRVTPRSLIYFLQQVSRI